MARDHAERVSAPDNVVYGQDALVSHWVKANIGEPFQTHDGQRALGIVHGGKLCAGVVFENYYGHSMIASVAITDVRALSRRRLARWFGYPFVTCNAKRLTVLIAESNTKSMAFCGRLGFEFEARLAGAAHDGSDLLVMRMFRHRCIWLRGLNG